MEEKRWNDESVLTDAPIANEDIAYQEVTDAIQRPAGLDELEPLIVIWYIGFVGQRPVTVGPGDATTPAGEFSIRLARRVLVGLEQRLAFVRRWLAAAEVNEDDPGQVPTGTTNEERSPA
jgi:hypothetical protein